MLLAAHRFVLMAAQSVQTPAPDSPRWVVALVSFGFAVGVLILGPFNRKWTKAMRQALQTKPVRDSKVLPVLDKIFAGALLLFGVLLLLSYLWA